MKCGDCVYYRAFPLTNNHWCDATKTHRRISEVDVCTDATCKVGKVAEQTEPKEEE